MTKTIGYGAALVMGAALVLSFGAATPAFACEQGCDGGGWGGGCWWGCSGGEMEVDNSVSITVSNSGTINNETEAEASTGGNYADGSYGGDGGKQKGDGGNGGDGGDAEGDGSNVGGMGGNGGSTGNGGNGGDAGPGGLVQTGDAEANAGSVNTLNTTEIEVEGCGCDESAPVNGWWRKIKKDNSVGVTVANSGTINNETEAEAKTGKNDADGSYGGDGGKQKGDAGNGGDGGDATGSDEECGWCGGGCGNWCGGGCGYWCAPTGCDGCDNGSNVGGDAGQGGHAGSGGDGGAGDVGGTVVTGNARSDSGAVNVMNTVLVRVLR